MTVEADQQQGILSKGAIRKTLSGKNQDVKMSRKLQRQTAVERKGLEKKAERVILDVEEEGLIDV